MKKSILIIMGGAIAIALTACNWGRIEKKATGEIVTKTIDLNNISEVTMKNVYVSIDDKSPRTPINLYYSEDERVEITTNESVFEDLKVKENSNTLVLSASKTTCYVVEDFEIKVYCNMISKIDLGTTSVLTSEAEVLGDQLEVKLSGASSARMELTNLTSLELDLSGASKFQSSTNVTIDTVNVNVSGASTVSIDVIKADKIDAHLSGASNATISGEVNSVKLSLSGASEFNGNSLVMSNADVKLSGASSAIIDVIDDLAYDISGASTLKYVSEPTNIGGSSSGGSTIKKK